MKKLTLALALALGILMSATGTADTRVVDNGDMDKKVAERLNLRAQPAAKADIIGSYYTGAEVETVATEPEEGYLQVDIGGKTGYMAEQYLITPEEMRARYGETYAHGRAAEVDLGGTWVTSEPVYKEASPASEKIGELQGGDEVQVMGFAGSWAYVLAAGESGEIRGYVRLTVLAESGDAKAAIVMGSDAAGGVGLYNGAGGKAEEIMTVKNGAACILLFGRSGGEWYRVRVGGVVGWIRNEPTENLIFLAGAPRSSVPYYPPLMQTAGDTLLYRDPGNKDDAYMTLGEGMKVEVLGITKEQYAYVRTLEGGAGAYESGDFGYVMASELAAAESSVSVGVAQADEGDLPVVLTNTPDKTGRMIGALNAGAEVRILAYTQTDYVQLALNGMTAYASKRGIRLITEGNGTPSDRIPQRAVVLHDAELFEEPADDADRAGSVQAGARVYMLAKLGEWAYVNAGASSHLDTSSTLEDKLGFIRLDALNAPAGTKHLTGQVTTDKVNMRERADRTSPIIGKARLGELLRIADYGSSWTCVVKEDGTRGYVMTEYLIFD